VRKLFDFYPSCISVAIVPVGLTSYRDRLTKLRSVSKKEAEEIIEWANEKSSEFAAKSGGKRFLYLSDEFYLIANREIPDENSYDDFPQLSNGVGMCRAFLVDLKERIKKLAQSQPECEMGIITGVLGQNFFSRYVIPLVNKYLPKLDINLVTVENELFGKSVTVSGLLAGRDIVKAIKAEEHSPLYILPPNCVNHEGRLLDELTAKDIEKEVSSSVLIPETTFVDESVIKICRGDRRI